MRVNNSIVIYTDGACSGNPGPGGWAWAVDRQLYDSGSENPSTNQRMEITAAAKAVERFADQYDSIEIVSDSQYVVKCFNEKWHVGWEKRGWKNAAKKPVANRDLWEPFIKNVLGHSNVKFTWVKGHSGHDMNDFVDELAVKAINRSS